MLNLVLKIALFIDIKINYCSVFLKKSFKFSYTPTINKKPNNILTAYCEYKDGFINNKITYIYLVKILQYILNDNMSF